MEKKKDWPVIELAREGTALVVVDMENEFCKPEGKCYMGPEVAPVIERTAVLLKSGREAGAKVVFVRSVRDPQDPEFTRFSREPILIEGTNGPVIVPELRPRPGEPVVEKHTHDCFFETEMDGVLRRRGIRPETHRIIVTGVMSNVCVYHAVLGFHVRAYYTVLLLDCTLGSPGGDEFVIAQFSRPAYNYNVTLTTSDRIRFTGLHPLGPE